MGIAVVVPSNRPDSLKKFMVAWERQLSDNRAELIVVKDGDEPQVEHWSPSQTLIRKVPQASVLNGVGKLIYNHTSAVRNLGFAYVAKAVPDAEYIVTLDDDVTPYCDTIGDHITQLNRRVPISWMATFGPAQPRGMPYGMLEEARVVLSHGVWYGVPDVGAYAQLRGDHKIPAEFIRSPIPKGCYFPMSGMNLAFHRVMLKHVYMAPSGPAVGFDRYDDIFAGIVAKRIIDDNGWAAVTGYATVHHDRASDVMANLVKEAPGIPLNERFWKGKEVSDQYFLDYADKFHAWQEFIGD